MLQKFRGKRSFFLPKKERSGEGRKITEHIVETLAFKLKPKRIIHQEDRRISKPVECHDCITQKPTKTQGEMEDLKCHRGIV